jgi:hypothetical protein
MKIMIVVRGGVVQSVMADGEASLDLIDYDNLDNNEAVRADERLAAFEATPGVRALALEPLE